MQINRISRIKKGIGIILLIIFPMPIYATCIGLGCTCTVTALPLAFGNYDPTSNTVNDMTGTVTVTGVAFIVGVVISYEIQLSKGNSSSYATRQLKNGNNVLNYNLYTTVGRTQIWGDSTEGTGSVSDGYTMIGLSNIINYTVYGRIPARQNVVAGAYSDTIVVTLIF